MRATASSEMSIAIDLVAAARQRQREAAVVAEAVEQPSARVARRRGAVLALIEEQPGLLAAPQVDLVARCRLSVTVDDLGHLAGAAPRPAARALRARAPADRCAPGCRAAAASSDERLDDQPAAGDRCPATAPARPGSRRSDRRSATAADRLRRAPAGSAVASICERLAERDRRLDPRAPRSALVAGASPSRQHAQRDLRSVAVERVAERAAARADAPSTMSPGSARTSATSAR